MYIILEKHDPMQSELDIKFSFILLESDKNILFTYNNMSFHEIFSALCIICKRDILSIDLMKEFISNSSFKDFIMIQNDDIRNVINWKRSNEQTFKKYITMALNDLEHELQYFLQFRTERVKQVKLSKD